MDTVLITATDCQKCNYVKSHIDCSQIIVYDRSDKKAIALMAFHEILNKDLHLPILIYDDLDGETQIIAGNGTKIVNKIREIVYV